MAIEIGGARVGCVLLFSLSLHSIVCWSMFVFVFFLTPKKIVSEITNKFIYCSPFIQCFFFPKWKKNETKLKETRLLRSKLIVRYVKDFTAAPETIFKWSIKWKHHFLTLQHFLRSAHLCLYLKRTNENRSENDFNHL